MSKIDKREFRNDFLEIEYEKESIANYQKEILRDGSVELFFQSNFSDMDNYEYGDDAIENIEENNREKAYVNISGYEQITKVETLGTKESIEIIKQLISKIDSSYKYYFFPGDYNLREDLIYIRRNIEDVKVIFSPRKKDGNKKYLAEQIDIDSKDEMNLHIEFEKIEEAIEASSRKDMFFTLSPVLIFLGKKVDYKGRPYIERVVKVLKDMQYGFSEAITKLEELQEEIEKLGVDEDFVKNFFLKD